jgi:hypothetical protein
MSSTKGRRRYSLVVNDFVSFQEYLIKFKEIDEESNEIAFKEKAFLSTIDARTTDFDDEDHLLAYLESKGHINFKHGEIYITYKESKETKMLDVIYADQPQLKYFASKYTTYVNTNDREFLNVYRGFISDMQKGRFYRYMVENGYINKRLKTLVDEYVYDNLLFRESSLITEFSRYKVIRGYILGKDKFNNLDYNIPKENIDFKIESDNIRPEYINTDDEELNGLTIEEVRAMFDIEDLQNREIEGKPIFDGLYEDKDKVKKLER